MHLQLLHLRLDDLHLRLDDDRWHWGTYNGLAPIFSICSAKYSDVWCMFFMIFVYPAKPSRRNCAHARRRCQLQDTAVSHVRKGADHFAKEQTSLQEGVECHLVVLSDDGRRTATQCTMVMTSEDARLHRHCHAHSAL